MVERSSGASDGVVEVVGGPCAVVGRDVRASCWMVVGVFFITHETRRRTALLLLAQFAIVEVVVQLTLVNSSDSADFFRK